MRTLISFLEFKNFTISHDRTTTIMDEAKRTPCEALRLTSLLLPYVMTYPWMKNIPSVSVPMPAILSRPGRTNSEPLSISSKKQHPNTPKEYRASINKKSCIVGLNIS